MARNSGDAGPTDIDPAVVAAADTAPPESQAVSGAAPNTEPVAADVVVPEPVVETTTLYINTPWTAAFVGNVDDKSYRVEAGGTAVPSSVAAALVNQGAENGVSISSEKG